MFKKPSPGKKTNLSQFGLIDMDIPDLDDNDDLDLSDDDMDLEAELAAISGGGPKRPRPKKPAPVPAANLDAMIAASLKDIPSDEDASGDDEDDPDLLNELKELAIDDDEPPTPPRRTSRPAPPPPGASVSTDSSMVSFLQDRITNYTVAEKNAKASGESSKARRFNRGLKTLNGLLQQATKGQHINEEDIPPLVIVKKAADEPQPPSAPPEPEPEVEQPLIDLGPPEPSQPEPSPPEPRQPPPPPPTEALSEEKQEGLQIILRRQQEFKVAALSSKRSGDKTLALEYLKVVKQFDMVVDAYKSGQEMDLNELPTPEMIATAFKSQRTEGETQTSTEPPPEPVSESPGLITASTVDEALRQRLTAFQQQESKAKEEGNTSKARRMGRIVKQYQDAIKQHAAGRLIVEDELPTPAGFAPLPTAGGSGVAAAAVPSPSPSPSPSSSSSSAGGAPRPAPRASASRHDKQLALLLLRQKQFKEAALKAKRNGDLEAAKEYLRASKGFDSVIEAAKGGLVVDLKSLPLPPKAKNDLEHTFDIVSTEDCGPSEDSNIDSTGNDEDVLSRLQHQLNTQLKLCHTNRDHNKEIGNIAEANRFEHLAVRVKQDLDLVVVAKGLGHSPPKFHYEERQFAVVQCNTDLSENNLELTIVRGIAYNVPNPKDIDTYVKFEFPYPQDAPVFNRTALVKDTNNPEYNEVYSIPIHRNRACFRVFKRHGVKFEVYSRSGWFRSDVLLATAVVKLAPLEHQITLHEAFPLMDGRRPAGGSLEVKLRVRTPLLQQQIENSSHRWLVIDN